MEGGSPEVPQSTAFALQCVVSVIGTMVGEVLGDTLPEKLFAGLLLCAIGAFLTAPGRHHRRRVVLVALLLALLEMLRRAAGALASDRRRERAPAGHAGSLVPRSWAAVGVATIVGFGFGSVGTTVLGNWEEDEASAATVTVPLVAERREDAARALLRSAGLGAQRATTASVSVPAGSAVRTAPAAGSKVRTGTTVALFISSGPPPARVTIPAVRGLPAAQARSLLADLGLRVTRAGAPSEQVPSGSATGSQPRAGSRVARGARVTLLVSSGPPPAGKVSVPAVRDLPERRAIARLREAGLDAIAEPRASETVPAGRALGTVPAAGTSVDRGARVRLVISSGTAVERATIPQLAGNSFEDARSRLEQLRLIAQRRAIDSSEPAGAVVSSDPAAGSSVPVGSTVILAVSSGTLVRVPDVVGAPARTAATEIKRAGLSPAEHDVVSDQPDGTVTSTDPKAGSEVPRGSEVVYDVSCGPTPCID